MVGVSEISPVDVRLPGRVATSTVVYAGAEGEEMKIGPRAAAQVPITVSRFVEL
jgi:hypothetical protein